MGSMGRGWGAEWKGKGGMVEIDWVRGRGFQITVFLVFDIFLKHVLFLIKQSRKLQKNSFFYKKIYFFRVFLRICL